MFQRSKQSLTRDSYGTLLRCLDDVDPSVLAERLFQH